MKYILPIRFLVLLLIVLPSMTSAHPGASNTSHFFELITHPFTGVDHLLTLLVVGALLYTVIRLRQRVSRQ